MVLLSKDKSKETAWHKAANRRHVQVLKRLWYWAKELQLIPEELRNMVLLSKASLKKRPGTRQQIEATLKY